ncbi:hypothetical protein [Microvirga sp. VF16]|uniref:hypothetical protein n=1 Tax=Microvirga sp. VF16 TaxID=2807101 RepID=UPI00193D1894|nr:hypothetical protein [Microvirga sp. VF16]QRM35586.1 hypothetical protein JO965_42935 [Microvirga sp. VF16]
MNIVRAVMAAQLNAFCHSLGDPNGSAPQKIGSGHFIADGKRSLCPVLARVLYSFTRKRPVASAAPPSAKAPSNLWGQIARVGNNEVPSAGCEDWDLGAKSWGCASAIRLKWSPTNNLSGNNLARCLVSPYPIGTEAGKRDQVGADMILAQYLHRIIGGRIAIRDEVIETILSCHHCPTLVSTISSAAHSAAE